MFQGDLFDCCKRRVHYSERIGGLAPLTALALNIMNSIDRLFNNSGVCMKGKIYYQPDRHRWMVYWYDQIARKNRFITKYKGNHMPCTAFKMNDGQMVFDKKGRLIPDKKKCKGYKLAEKLLSTIQGRWEQHENGECAFRIEEFTKNGWTDTIEYYYKWIKEDIKPKRKPATIAAYESYGRNWVETFFTETPVRLHEIKADTLVKMLNFIIKGLKKKPSKNPNTELILNIHFESPDMTGAAIHRLLKEKYNVKTIC